MRLLPSRSHVEEHISGVEGGHDETDNSNPCREHYDRGCPCPASKLYAEEIQNGERAGNDEDKDFIDYILFEGPCSPKEHRQHYIESHVDEPKHTKPTGVCVLLRHDGAL